MRILQISPLFWNYWASVVYILGSISYMFMDSFCLIFSVDNYASFVIYIILANLFVIDAILYAIDWYTYAILLRKHKNDLINYRSELIACIFQHFGSYCYLLGAILALDKTKYMAKILILNIIGIFSLVLEAIFTIIGWQISLRTSTYLSHKHFVHDIYFWGHTLNLTASLMYLLATILAGIFFRMKSIKYSLIVQLLQIIGDIIYVVDSFVYMGCYMEDKRSIEENREKESIKENISHQVYDNPGQELEPIVNNKK
ncbi:unnamed protein product [Didymodactylos carnosus]|uniref:Uncharacterized protein n=1 Tax=Didymodactylos carnosus TaxID=1234261 RepID=A0A814D4Y6_9BILA|nr:unnamed protein product [Didymodactylos carnosus]CAF1146719.1 unnamed protein product [Didymodactylos carnosus]CAF3726094.1 unnamed protein product [Didymodactylos carnosus]CAF3948807.1 unnamed protein product [Didymodactylos carnosus]